MPLLYTTLPSFASILTKFSNPILGILAGAFLTTALQSSSASVGILQALSTTGSITVSAAFPIILGQNIGSCTTVLISSIGASKNAKRAAAAHLTFNVIGVIIAMVLFYGSNAIFGLPFFEDNVSPATIAIIHSLFNIFSTIILFPFGKQLEKLMYVIIRDDKNGKEVQTDDNGLVEERFLINPGFALDKVKDKCDEMATLAKNNISQSIEFIKKYSKNVLVGVKLEKDGQYLYVSSMYDIQGSKISRRLYSGRIKNANIDNDENE